MNDSRMRLGGGGAPATALRHAAEQHAWPARVCVPTPSSATHANACTWRCRWVHSAPTTMRACVMALQGAPRSVRPGPAPAGRQATGRQATGCPAALARCIRTLLRHGMAHRLQQPMRVAQVAGPLAALRRDTLKHACAAHSQRHTTHTHNPHTLSRQFVAASLISHSQRRRKGGVITGYCPSWE